LRKLQRLLGIRTIALDVFAFDIIEVRIMRHKGGSLFEPHLCNFQRCLATDKPSVEHSIGKELSLKAIIYPVITILGEEL